MSEQNATEDTSPSTPLLTPELMAQLEQLQLVSRRIFRGRLRGERRSARKGQSVEFADFRSYVPGDDLRFVDWNTYARLDRLFLKLFFEEEDLHFYALLDASPSMEFGSPTKLDWAKHLAAALGFIALVRGDRVKIETLSQSVASPSPALRGRAAVRRMLDQLGTIAVQPPTSLARGVRNFCIRNQGKGIAVVISDFLDKDGYREALGYLLSRQMDIYVIQVLAKEELDPQLAGEMRLVDSEDHDVAEISASGQVLARYRKRVAAFVAEVRDDCTRRGIHHLLADNQLPIERLVSNMLRKRGLVS